MSQNKIGKNSFRKSNNLLIEKRITTRIKRIKKKRERIKIYTIS